MSESAMWIEAVRARIAAARSTTDGVPDAALDGAWRGQLDALAAYAQLIEDAAEDVAERDALAGEIDALAEALASARAAWDAAASASTSWEVSVAGALAAVDLAERSLHATAEVAAVVAWTAGTRARQETLRARARRVQTRVVAVRAGLSGAAPVADVANKRLAGAAAWATEASDVAAAWIALAEEGLAERRDALAAPVRSALAAVVDVPRDGHVYPLSEAGADAESSLTVALEALELADFEAVAQGGLGVLNRLDGSSAAAAQIEEACAAAHAARDEHDALMASFAADVAEVTARRDALVAAQSGLAARALVWAGRAAEGAPGAWSAPVSDVAAADGTTWGPKRATGVAPPLALTTGVEQGLALLAALDVALSAAEAFVPALVAASADADVDGAALAFSEAELALDVATSDADEQEIATAQAEAAWVRAVVEDAASRARTEAEAAASAEIEAQIVAVEAAWRALLPEEADGGWIAADGDRTVFVPLLEAPSVWAPEAVAWAAVDADAAPVEQAMKRRRAAATARLAAVTEGLADAERARGVWDASVARARQWVADARREAAALRTAAGEMRRLDQGASEARDAGLGALAEAEAAAGVWSIQVPEAWQAARAALRTLADDLDDRAAAFDGRAAALEAAVDDAALDGITAVWGGGLVAADTERGEAHARAAAAALQVEVDQRATWAADVVTRRGAVDAVAGRVDARRRALAEAEAQLRAERCTTHEEAAAWRAALQAAAASTAELVAAADALAAAWAAFCAPTATTAPDAVDSALHGVDEAVGATEARAFEVDVEAELALAPRAERRAAFASAAAEAHAAASAWRENPVLHLEVSQGAFTDAYAAWCARTSAAWDVACRTADAVAADVATETLEAESELARLAEAHAEIAGASQEAALGEAVVALAAQHADEVAARAASVATADASRVAASHAIVAARASTDPRAEAWRSAVDRLSSAVHQLQAADASLLAVWASEPDAGSIASALARLEPDWRAAVVATEARTFEAGVEADRAHSARAERRAAFAATAAEAHASASAWRENPVLHLEVSPGAFADAYASWCARTSAAWDAACRTADAVAAEVATETLEAEAEFARLAEAHVEIAGASQQAALGQAVVALAAQHADAIAARAAAVATADASRVAASHAIVAARASTDPRAEAWRSAVDRLSSAVDQLQAADASLLALWASEPDAGSIASALAPCGVAWDEAVEAHALAQADVDVRARAYLGLRERFDAEVRAALAAATSAQAVAWEALAGELDGVTSGAHEAEVRALWASTRPDEPLTDAWVAEVEAFAGLLDAAQAELTDAQTGFIAADRPREADDAALSAFREARSSGERARATRRAALSAARGAWHAASEQADVALGHADARARQVLDAWVAVAAAAEPLPILPDAWCGADGAQPFGDAVQTRDALLDAVARRDAAEATLAAERAVVVASAQGRAAAAAAQVAAADRLEEANAWLYDAGAAADASRAHLLAAATGWARAALLAPRPEPDPAALRWRSDTVVRALDAANGIRAELASSWDVRDTLVAAIEAGESAWDAPALALGWSSHHLLHASRYGEALAAYDAATEADRAAWRAQAASRLADAAQTPLRETEARQALTAWRAERARTAEPSVGSEDLRAAETEADIARLLAQLSAVAEASGVVVSTDEAQAGDEAIAEVVAALDAARTSWVEAVAAAQTALQAAWASRIAAARQRVQAGVREVRATASAAGRTAEIASADAQALRGQGQVDPAWTALQGAVRVTAEALSEVDRAEAELAEASDVVDVERAADAAMPVLAAAGTAVSALDDATRGLHEAVRHVLRVAFDALAASAARASDTAAEALDAAALASARAMALDAVARGGQGWDTALASWRAASSARIEGLGPARRAPDLLARTASLAAAEAAVAAAEAAVAADAACASAAAGALAALTACALQIASTRAEVLASFVADVREAWDIAGVEVHAAADADQATLDGWTLPVADALRADIGQRIAAFAVVREHAAAVLDGCVVDLEEPVERLSALAAAQARAQGARAECLEAVAAAASARAAFEDAAAVAFDDQHVAFAAETVEAEERRTAWVARAADAREGVRGLAGHRPEAAVIAALAAFADATERADASSASLAAGVPSVALADDRLEGVAAIRTLRTLLEAWSTASAAHDAAAADVHAAVAREDHLAAYRAAAAMRLQALWDQADERADELLLTLEAARAQVEGAAEAEIAARWDALVAVSGEVPGQLDAVRALGVEIAAGNDEADIDARYARAEAAASAVRARLEEALSALPRVLSDHLNAVQTARQRLEARMSAGRSAHRVEALARRVAVARSRMLAATVQDPDLRPVWVRARRFADAFEDARRRVVGHQAVADASWDGEQALAAAAEADAGAVRAADIAALTGAAVARGLRAALWRARGVSLQRRAEARARQVGWLRAEARRSGVASRLTALERALARWAAALGLEDETSLGPVNAAIALAREADDVLAQAISRGSADAAFVAERVAAERALAEALADVARAERAWVAAVHAADRQRRARYAQRVQRRDAAEDAARRLAEAASSDTGRQIRLLERGYALAVRGADAAGQWAWGLDLAEALGEAGRIEEAVALAAALAQVAGGTEDAALRLAGLRARLLRRAGDVEAAGAVAVAALASIPASARGAGVAALAWEVGVSQLARAPEEAVEAFRRARDAAEARWERARATLGLAGALAKTGDVEAAFALASQAAGQFAALGDDASRAAARALSADLLRRQGHLGAASLLAGATRGADHAITARIAARVAVDAGLGARALAALAGVDAPSKEREAALAALAGAPEPRDVGSLWAASKALRVRARAGRHRLGAARSAAAWAADQLTSASG